MKNHYELLNISENASYEEIKSAYRKLAIRYHPDKNPNNPHAEELFKKIAIAYDTLSSPAKKSRYDAILSYQQFQSFSQQTTDQYRSYTRPTTYQYNKPVYTPYYRKGSWLNLSNKHFIAVLSLSCVLVFGAIGMANFVQHHQKEVLKRKGLAARKTYLKLTNESKNALVNRNYEASLLLANQLIKELPKYLESVDFKRSILSDIARKGTVDLQEGRYNKAIEAFTVLTNNHEPIRDKAAFNYYLGLAYYYNDQAEKAINYLLSIKTDDYPAIPTLLAIIYRDKFNDSEQALAWHAEAKQILSEKYKNVGFQFVPSDAPQEHFDTYYQSALTNYNLKNYPAAIQDLRGALFLRSANRDALYMKGLCELELGLAEACNSFEKAKKNGHFFVDEVIEKNCK